MKTYEKPRLMALSLSGTDTLCGSCAYDAVGDNMSPEIKNILELAGLITSDGTVLEGTFCPDMTCDKDKTVESFCKFASVEWASMIFSS